MSPPAQALHGEAEGEAARRAPSTSSWSVEMAPTTPSSCRQATSCSPCLSMVAQPAPTPLTRPFWSSAACPARRSPCRIRNNTASHALMLFTSNERMLGVEIDPSNALAQPGLLPPGLGQVVDRGASALTVGPVPPGQTRTYSLTGAGAAESPRRGETRTELLERVTCEREAGRTWQAIADGRNADSRHGVQSIERRGPTRAHPGSRRSGLVRPRRPLVADQ